eukprot:4650186-Prymnesium_polylepis.1
MEADVLGRWAARGRPAAGTVLLLVRLHEEREEPARVREDGSLDVREDGRRLAARREHREAAEAHILDGAVGVLQLRVAGELEKTASPNLVLSSHPKERMRTALANLKAAIISPASVTSVRIRLEVEGSGAGTSTSGASSASTSFRLAATVDGATPRANCAHRSARSSFDSAWKRPPSSRRGSSSNSTGETTPASSSPSPSLSEES